MNGVGAGIGLVFLADGLRRNSLFHVNAGLAFIVTLVIVRFFDESWSFVWKGIVFVLVGLAFLITNWRLQRRMREREKG
jgi:membrane protein implicated in regulation of membrane protease activity